MSQHLKTGEKGEDLAKLFLLKKGYSILELNWRFSRAEVDIIAKDKDILVFVEVKTRSTAIFGDPALAVNAKKQQLLTDAASAYMDQIGHEWEIRFDIISVILRQDEYDLQHFQDAFFPGW